MAIEPPPGSISAASEPPSVSVTAVAEQSPGQVPAESEISTARQLGTLVASNDPLVDAVNAATTLRETTQAHSAWLMRGIVQHQAIENESLNRMAEGLQGHLDAAREENANLRLVELILHGAYDRNQSAKERIVLRAWSYGPVQLAAYFVTVGIGQPGFGEQLGATPMYDNLCWLGERVLQPNQWLFLYTGRGYDTTYPMPEGPPIQLIYWNRPSLIFAVPNIVPVLLRMDGVAVQSSPNYVLNQPQLPSPSAMLSKLASK